MLFFKDITEAVKRLEKKLDGFINDTDKRLDAIEKVEIIQDQNLREHMRRSEHLETIVSALQEKEIKPIRKHVNMVEGGLKLLGILALVATLLKAFGLIPF